MRQVFCWILCVLKSHRLQEDDDDDDQSSPTAIEPSPQILARPSKWRFLPRYLSASLRPIEERRSIVIADEAKRRIAGVGRGSGRTAAVVADPRPKRRHTPQCRTFNRFSHRPARSDNTKSSRRRHFLSRVTEKKKPVSANCFFMIGEFYFDI